MASNSLTGVSLSTTYLQLLHIGTGTIAAGFTMRDGAGNATPLSFTAAGVAALSGALTVAGNVTSNGITIARASGATARTATLPDFSGTIRVEMVAVKSADQSNSTVTAAAVTGLTATLEANATYEFEALLIVQSAATTTGVQIEMSGPSGQTSFLSYTAHYVNGTSLGTGNWASQWFTAFATNMANLTAPDVATPFPLQVKGVIKTTASTPSSALGFSFRSEVAASSVTVLAGSVLRVRRLL